MLKLTVCVCVCVLVQLQERLSDQGANQGPAEPRRIMGRLLRRPASDAAGEQRDHRWRQPPPPSQPWSSPPTLLWLAVPSSPPPGFYFDRMEITPPAVGVYRFDADDGEVGGPTSYLWPSDPLTSDLWTCCCSLQVSQFSAQQEVRALVEGQFLSRKLHAERLGHAPGMPRPPPTSWLAEVLVELWSSLLIIYYIILLFYLW